MFRIHSAMKSIIHLIKLIFKHERGDIKMKYNLTAKLALICLVFLTFTACERNDSAEKVGEDMDRAVENMGNKMGNAAENAGDKAEAAGDKIEDKTD